MDARLSALQTRHPEWRPWVELFREVEAELAGGGPALDVEWEDGAERPAEAPLLDGARMVLRASEARARVLPVELGGEADTVEARMRAVPLLAAAARRLADRVPAHWPHGYCPVCGAWPTLAERVGIGGARRLRCGRCGTGWDAPILWCVYCGERNHRQLGALVTGEDEQGPRIEFCRTCGGYLKSLAVLTPAPLGALLLADAETVELDLAALERGLRRPSSAGHTVRFRVDR